MVALVRYPDCATFGALVRQPEYLAIEPLRTGAVSEIVSQPTIQLVP